MYFCEKYKLKEVLLLEIIFILGPYLFFCFFFVVVVFCFSLAVYLRQGLTVHSNFIFFTSIFIVRLIPFLW